MSPRAIGDLDRETTTDPARPPQMDVRRAPRLEGLGGPSAAKALALFIAGGVVGGGAATAIWKDREKVVFVDREVLIPSPSRPSVTTVPALPAEPEGPKPLLPVTAPLHRAAPSAGSTHGNTAASRDVDLAAERAVLERARSAMARGNAETALAAVREHERSFPRGQLAEEREALAIQALSAVGRSGDASKRREVFRKQFPASLLLPVIDDPQP